MNNTILVKQIEDLVYKYLVDLSFNNHPVQQTGEKRVILFHFVAQALGSQAVLTTGFFNDIISNMRKVGILFTSNGGDDVFLSNYSFKEETKKRQPSSQLIPDIDIEDRTPVKGVDDDF